MSEKTKEIIVLNSNIEDTIDVEVLCNYFPEGHFIAQVRDDSFDDEMFEFLFDEDKEGWIQLLVGESCLGSCVSDGQTVFIDPNGTIIWTNESAVKLAKDLIMLRSGHSMVVNAASLKSQQQELICVK